MTGLDLPPDNVVQAVREALALEFDPDDYECARARFRGAEYLAAVREPLAALREHFGADDVDAACRLLDHEAETC